MERLKGIDLVAGMVLFTKDGGRYIVFPVQIVNHRFAFANLDGGWTTYLSEDAIIKINTPPRGNTIDSGVTLWKKTLWAFYERDCRSIWNFCRGTAD